MDKTFITGINHTSDHEQWEQGRETYQYIQRRGYIRGYRILGKDDDTECELCNNLKGKYSGFGLANPLTPFHPNCRCYIEIDWTPWKNPEDIFREFFDPKTGLIKMGGNGRYAPTRDLLVMAINYFRRKAGLSDDFRWEDLVIAGFFRGDGSEYRGATWSAEFVVGMKLNLIMTEIYFPSEPDSIWDKILDWLPDWFSEDNLQGPWQMPEDPVNIIYESLAQEPSSAEAREKGMKSIMLNKEVTLTENALKSLVSAQIEMLAYGLSPGLKIVESYRTYGYQQSLIDSHAEMYGWDELSEEDKKAISDKIDWNKYPYKGSDEEVAKKHYWLWHKDHPRYNVAMPGTSKHETGAAIDIYPYQDDSVPADYINTAKKYLEKNGWKQSTLKGDSGHFNYIGN